MNFSTELYNKIDSCSIESQRVIPRLWWNYIGFSAEHLQYLPAGSSTNPGTTKTVNVSTLPFWQNYVKNSKHKLSIIDNIVCTPKNVIRYELYIIYYLWCYHWLALLVHMKRQGTFQWVYEPNEYIHIMLWIHLAWLLVSIKAWISYNWVIMVRNNTNINYFVHNRYNL